MEKKAKATFLVDVVYLDWGGGYTDSIHLSKFIEHFDSVIYKWHLKTENIIFKRIFSMSKSSTKNLHIANKFISKVCLFSNEKSKKWEIFMLYSIGL